eukprot:TRINITY_DN10422_c0_g2_i1.p1 TRINITY_DN10422_c0_g2~~TRINITY_DN10422_c0_g2_i1.p1  ORF type:complete len:801 (-),score=196.97 TRINITY_DN10422_c0_g2_i1:27-2276(-)
MNKQIVGNQKLIDVGKRLLKEKEFFHLVHKFLSGLEKASGSDKEEMIKILPDILKSRKDGKSDLASSVLDKEIAVAVEKAKVTVSKEGGGTVTVNSMDEEQILANAKRNFQNSTAAAKFCLEKRQNLFLELGGMVGGDSRRGSSYQARNAPSQSVVNRFHNHSKSVAKAPVEEKSEVKEEKNVEEIPIPAPEDPPTVDNLMLLSADESTGSIPASVEEDLTAVEKKSDEPPKWAIAEETYEAVTSNELSLAKGLILEILQIREGSTWLVSGNGRVGYCAPSRFKVITEREALDILNERALESKFDDDSGSETEDFELNGDADLELLQEQLFHKKSNSTSKSEESDLRCGYCHLPVSSEEFYELNGIVCCKDDLLKNFLKCDACSEPIVGDHVNLTSRRLHPKCAICTVCSKSMKNVAQIHERQGKLYCRKHYDDLFGKVCGRCNQGIYGPVVAALGKQWHPEHFVCSGSCGEILQQDYLVSGGKAYCPTDFKEEVGKRCAKCDEIIMTNALNIGDFFYHQSCVICNKCRTVFITGMSFFPEQLRSGEKFHRFLCSAHYREKYLRPCAKCNTVIVSSEQRTIVEEVVYHNECVKCEECGAPLAGREVFFDNSSPPRMICTADFERLVQNKCGICSQGLEAGKFVIISSVKCHKDCVKCSVCQTNLLEEKNNVHRSRKNPQNFLCTHHFAEETNTKCTSCEEFIVSGGVVSIMGKKFHKACVICETCKTDLTGQKVLLIRNKPRCKLHLRG